MMTRLNLVGVLLSLFLLSACSGISVTTDYDTSRDFPGLKTYAWLEPQRKLIVDPLVDNDLMNNRVKSSVEAELAMKGMRAAADGEQPDFLVTYHVTAEDRIRTTSTGFYGSYGYYPCWGGCSGFGVGYSPNVHVQQYKQGTFMLDVVDPVSKTLMWRGVAGKRLTSGTPSENDAFVSSIVSAILAEFPPY